MRVVEKHLMVKGNIGGARGKTGQRVDADVNDPQSHTKKRATLL